MRKGEVRIFYDIRRDKKRRSETVEKKGKSEETRMTKMKDMKEER